MKRAGRIVELDNVREFARAVGPLVQVRYPKFPLSMVHPIGRFATHCLCPIDVEASAKAGGWEIEPTDGWPDYLLRRPSKAAQDPAGRRSGVTVAEASPAQNRSQAAMRSRRRSSRSPRR